MCVVTSDLRNDSSSATQSLFVPAICQCFMQYAANGQVISADYSCRTNFEICSSRMDSLAEKGDRRKELKQMLKHR